jgi:predicted secreted Zn-dependent protease
VLASTVDAGLLRTAAERKNDERILVQIRDKDCVALEVRYHKVCYSNYTIFLAREAKTTTTCVPMYERSYDVFCKEVVETEIIKGKAIMYMMHLLEKFVVIAKETENVDASKYRSSKLKQRLINSYPQLVFYCLNLEMLVKLYMLRTCILLI